MTAAPVVALVGPTASGKTQLGIELAQRFDAEIINADSRQVYRRLDIGSAKPTALQRAAVAHHCLDVVEPDEQFDCAQFRDLAERAIADMQARGKRVLIVGGSGLYVKVLRRGLFAGPPRDAELRAQLTAEEAAQPGTLHRRLQTVDPAAAARLHANDRVRLIRALEVYLLTSRPLSDWQREHAATHERLIHTLVLDVPRPQLYQRIEARCEAMMAAGLVEEVRGLYAAGFEARLPSLQSLGYREIGAHVRGECDLPSAVEQMKKATRNFAKRQLTWFRGDSSHTWLEPTLDVVVRAAQQAWTSAASV